MNTLAQVLRNKRKPETEYDTRIQALIARLEQAVKLAETQAKNLQSGKAYDAFNPAEKVAKRVAEEQITEYRTMVGEKVQKIIDDTEKEKKQMLADTKNAMQDMANVFQKELDIVLKSVEHEAHSQMKMCTERFAVQEKSIESTRIDLKDKMLTFFTSMKNKVDTLRGPKGEDGAKGKDGKNGSPDNGKQIATKLNTTTESVEMKVIKGLESKIQSIKSIARAKSGGGMGNTVFKTFSCNGVLTTFTLDYAPSSGGNAIILIYQGQVLENGTHFTVSGKTITTTFTPDNGTTLFAWSIR